MTSDSLINVSDRYIDLDQIKEDIQKSPKSHLNYSSFPTLGTVLEDNRLQK
jgi:uncharacterized LabA/DUF88 family protein